MLKLLSRCLAGVFVLCCSLTGCTSPSAATATAEPVFNNPLVRQRADPQVILHDGWYYYTATVPEYDRIELRRTRSLNDLGKADTKVVWTKHDKGPMSHNIWAPEIHHIDGKWYIYFSAGRADAHGEIRLYVLENRSSNPLEGKWTERGQLKTEWDTFSLDATTFAHKGQRYLVWTQRPPEPDHHSTNIYIAKMDTPMSISGKQVRLTRPDYDWEKVIYSVNEAPAVLIKNGRVFIAYSGSATNASYAIGMVTASADADLLDSKSWSKSATPVFKSSEKNGQYGPGHNYFTTTPDGKTDILIYHARNFKEIKGESLGDPNRHTRAQVLHWNADGTPAFGEPVAD